MNELVIATIVVMLMLALGIIFFVVLYQRRVIRHQQDIKRINDQKQLELMQASIQGEEEERMRIATELHDDVGVTLSSVRLFLHAAAKESGQGPIISQSKELLDVSINKIRNISHRLQPVLLIQLGLQASLESFAAMMSRSGAVHITYHCLVPLPRFDEHVELSIYRIVQELTSNIIRHGGADNIVLETLLTPDCFKTTIAHDGAGLTDDMFREQVYKKGAIGLKNIINRLKTINASIGFDRLNEKDFNITILTPLTQTKK